MSIIVGELRNKIIITAPTTVRDDYGSFINTYQSIATLRAGVKYLGGTKATNNDEIFTSYRLEFYVYYRSFINDECRIVFQLNNYKIDNIEPIGMNQYLKITCTKIND